MSEKEEPNLPANRKFHLGLLAGTIRDIALNVKELSTSDFYFEDEVQQKLSRSISELNLAAEMLGKLKRIE